MPWRYRQILQMSCPPTPPPRFRVGAGLLGARAARDTVCLHFLNLRLHTYVCVVVIVEVEDNLQESVSPHVGQRYKDTRLGSWVGVFTCVRHPAGPQPF